MFIRGKEPTGFKDAVWGNDIVDLRNIEIKAVDTVNTDYGDINVYCYKGGDFNIAEISVEEIYMYFWRNKFYLVGGYLKDLNLEEAKKILVKEFGEGEDTESGFRLEGEITLLELKEDNEGLWFQYGSKTTIEQQEALQNVEKEEQEENPDKSIEEEIKAFSRIDWGQKKEVFSGLTETEIPKIFPSMKGYEKKGEIFKIGNTIFSRKAYMFVNDELFGIWCREAGSANWEKLQDIFTDIFGEIESGDQNNLWWTYKGTIVELSYLSEGNYTQLTLFSKKMVMENTEKKEAMATGRPSGDIIICPYCGDYAEYEKERNQGTAIDNISTGIIGGLLTRNFWGGLMAANMAAGYNNRRIKIYRCQRCGNAIEVPI